MKHSNDDGAADDGAWRRYCDDMSYGRTRAMYVFVYSVLYCTVLCCIVLSDNTLTDVFGARTDSEDIHGTRGLRRG